MRLFSACPKDCFDACSIWSEVEDKIKIYGNKNHPITNGFLCYKSKFFVDAHYSEKRVLYPMKAVGKKGDGKFERIEWSKALETIADKINETIESHGASSILSVEYAGNRGLLSYYFPQRFFNYLGAAKLMHTMCDEAGARAVQEVYGNFNSAEPSNILNSEMVIYWGINPVWTNVHGYYITKKSKAYMVVIDPLVTESAKKADLHVKIKAGTDKILALGIANYLIENKKYDEKFIESSTEGFKDFTAKVKKYNLNYTSSITGIKKEEIESLAETYFNKKSIIQMGYGFQRGLNGAESVKSISILPALKGEKNGLIYSLTPDIDFKYLAGENNDRIQIKQSQLGKELKDKDITFLFIYNSNPFNTLPNQETLRDAVKQDIFTVVHDIFFTDSTDFADIILPATTFFEQNDLVTSYFHDYINLNQKITEPKGEAKSNVEVFTLLAKQMHLDSPELLEPESEIISRILQQLNIDIGNFYKDGFAKINVSHPSNKINFNMVDASSFQVDQAEGFLLLTLTPLKSMHSQFNILTPFDTSLRINNADALKIGVKDGDRVLITSRAGSATVNVLITDEVPQNVVVAYKGSWPKLNGGKNINFVVEDLVQDHYGYGTALQSTHVFIKKSR